MHLIVPIVPTVSWREELLTPLKRSINVTANAYVGLTWNENTMWSQSRCMIKQRSSTILEYYTIDRNILQNMWTYVNSFVTLRLPQNSCGSCLLAPWFQQGDFYGLEVFHTLHYQFAYIQYLMTLLSSINRCTMVFFPSTYEKVCSTGSYCDEGVVKLL